MDSAVLSGRFRLSFLVVVEIGGLLDVDSRGCDSVDGAEMGGVALDEPASTVEE
jgi:hypothetical protein